MKTIQSVLNLLNRRERWQMLFILMFMLPNALMQVAGVASVMPFIAVMAQPELVESNSLLAALYSALGKPAMREFLTILASVALVLLVVGNALAAFTTWLILRFSYMRVHTLSRKLMEIYLGSEYHFFLLRNPSDLTKNVINEVNHLVTGFLMPLLQLAANGFIVTALLLMLLWKDPILAMTVGLILGGSYGLIYIILRNRMRTLGRRRLEANARRFKTTHEAFGAIKDLKVSGRENYYLNAYSDASYAFANNQSSHQVIAQMPRYALESIAFGVVLLIALYLTATQTSSQGVLPVIALYAMAGYRLMPALQKIFDNAATLRFSAPVVERINEEMSQSTVQNARTAYDTPSPGRSTDTPLALHNALTLEHIAYRYHGMTTPVLNDITITIKARTTVAFVGESGAGKSTLVDIILGLLKPDDGSILVDGIPLDDHNLSQWRHHLGYVPQAIYLADDTLRRNIALGIPDREIDEEAVITAAKAAAIHDFITRELPDGYETVAGDRGIRLSGGQRQRIGIARALYGNPELLILDEATSALDGSTEAAVMDAIDQLSGQKTIIMIAHRLSTVKNCDQLYLLKNGKLVANGTYDHLLSNNADFRRMEKTAHASTRQ
ncbi:ABC transporter ATP-binding protein [Thiohalophilus sp.]|uniref:ABC transporter ATP-binding protein n=1 Tax=Thiohalophilus sp. TaxID=3028392 RepID=UPI002ACD90FA|nr:ABC transporter ATP-binding protein [Thiohalophilus sp.]MDZ7803435.1 ABC transporter ATP-binding protein [Thiohalophilus sp.]